MALLENWTGEHLGAGLGRLADEHRLPVAGLVCQVFPELPPATLPEDAEESKWKFDELYEFLSGEDGLSGDSAKVPSRSRKPPATNAIATAMLARPWGPT